MEEARAELEVDVLGGDEFAWEDVGHRHSFCLVVPCESRVGLGVDLEE